MSKNQLMQKTEPRVVSLEQGALLPGKQRAEVAPRPAATEGLLNKASIPNSLGVARTAQNLSPRELATERSPKKNILIKTHPHPRQDVNYVPTVLDRFVTWLAQRLRAAIDRLLGYVPQKFWLLELLRKRDAARVARENERRIVEKAKAAAATPALKR